MKNRCTYKEPTSTILDNANYEREYLKLNRLESYLLKLVIPFIRVAHCPRGSYFKVKGDLILISSDISQSLEKILPLHQSLIPVAFKRKVSYSGSYIEEYIEKEKVQMYFSWLKENNHLYKNIDISTELIDQFANEARLASAEFEANTKGNDSSNHVDDDDEVIEEEETFLNSFNDNPF